MGERSNVVMKCGEEQVVFYAHWFDNEDMLERLRAGLLRGKNAGRLTDYQYLNRIVFCAIVAGDNGDTGFGITQVVHDSGHPVITVDLDKKTVQVEGGEAVTIQDFIK